ncbi:NTF2 fold immunity protein [Stenotrophomonas sp.]|uniref:NTF2 fold immunity protein n=1 Tax=Stenotrophomonas sp. TaxID=69392 RepID=UPI0028AD0534|nr:NTF2 fold immunity protein [Stenotrophomonas sp.]
MTFPLALTFLLAASASDCPAITPSAMAVVSTELDAIAAAKAAWHGTFSPATVQEREPYLAELSNGTWRVFGTLPEGWRGGTPEALVCASNGIVLKVFHGR